MNTKTRNRITAIVIVLVLIIGIIIGSNVNTIIQDNRMKAYAFEKENSANISVGYIEVENALFPCHGGVRISQTAYENGYAPNGSSASHGNSVAMDVIPDNGLFYAPFSGRIVSYNGENGACNEFIFQSDNRVRWSDDTYDYVSMIILHSNDYDIINEAMNKYIAQNEAIYSNEAINSGRYDRAISIGGSSGPGNPTKYANHFDIQITRGQINTFASNAARNGSILHYNCLFINPEVTNLYQHPLQDRALNVNENLDPYEGYWFEREAFKYSGNTSTLKVSCPNSLAFEKDYTIRDFLFGNVLADGAEKLATIQNIVDNYDTYSAMDYTGLSEFERYVFDSCKYEWVDSIPVESNTKPSHPQNVTITFDAGEGAFCDETERTITWGTCTNDFPKPFKENQEFLGWFDTTGEQYNGDSLIMSDVTLYARWSIVALSTTEIITTTIQTTQVISDTDTIVIADDIEKMKEQTDIYNPALVQSTTTIAQTNNMGNSGVNMTDVQSTITETLATERRITVPNVVGNSEINATTVISNAGLNYTIYREYDSSVPAGNIVSQSPDSGVLPEGGIISITVSNGKAPVDVSNISLNYTSKTLNTQGNSTSFVINATISPNNADNKNVTFSSSDSSVAEVDENGKVTAIADGICTITATAGNVTAICEITVKTAYTTSHGNWSSWSTIETLPSESLEVQTKDDVQQIPEKYQMKYYCTKDYNGNRVYSDTSISGQYDAYQRSSVYGEWSYLKQLGDQDYWIYHVSEIGEEIPPGGWLLGSQSGYNGSSVTGYAVPWGSDTIMAFIDEIIYQNVTTTYYRYRTVTSIPVEYN